MGTTVFQGPGTPFPPELLEVYNLVPQGLSAEMIAEMWHITREQADEYAARSQRRAGEAQANGWFDREIAPVVVGANGDGRVISQDQGIRPDTTAESLASLQPAFKPDGIMHAGNSSQITDGAAAILLMSAERANALGITPRARIAAQTVVGVDPVTMLTGPIPATTRLLERSGLQIDDIDLFEVNEAFAPVVLAWEREHHPDMERVNVNGGAIALGHPLGASGARLMTTLLHELERRDGRYGLQTMCCGGGLGTGTLIDRSILDRGSGLISPFVPRMPRAVTAWSHPQRWPKSPCYIRPDPQMSPATSTAMKKVLIIEDYYALADIESLLCTMEGYEVKVAKSGDEGLAAFVEFQPDLVLLDLMLPGDLSGREVLERIRTDHGSDPKVLVVSALVNASTAPKLEAYGNVQTLAKPFKIKELASRIQSMLAP